MEDEYNQDCFDWFSDMSEAWPENSCHTKISSYQKENSIDGNSFFSGSYFHSNNNSSDRSDPSNWREWKQSSVLKPAQGVKRRIGVNANIEEQSFYEKEGQQLRIQRSDRDKDRPILHPFSSTNPHQRVILDWLSEREERKVYQNIRNSVHKEKMLEYEPILSRLVEKQYLLMKQAMSLGLTTNPVLASVPADSLLSLGFDQIAIYQTARRSESSDARVVQKEVGAGFCSGPAVEEPPFNFLEKFKEEFCSKQEEMDSSSLCNAACTRDGSQFIQNNIDLASPSDVSSILRFTIGHILRLSCNSFGNFVIQKIFEYALPHEKSEMAWTLLKDVKTLCSSKFGTRVMQAILPHLEGYQISLILDQVIQDIVHFSTNEYTNHTMLRLIEKMVSLCPLEEPKFVHSVQKHLKDFIEDPDAMRIILKMVYCCSDELKSGLKDSLLCRIERDSSIVSSATAYILVVELYENGTERDKQRIFEMCRDRIGKLASLKWGSRIVHSILQTGSKQEVAVILQNLNNKVRLRSLLSTKYGGVTVQKMLMLLDVPDLVQVFTILQNMKVVSNSIPLEAAESLVLSIIKTTKEPSIVDISSGFLTGGREFPLSAEAGLGFFRVKRWMLSIFKGEKVELEVTEIPLFILCLTEIAVYKDNPGLGLLRQHLISFIEGIINQHYLKESRSKK